ncbi:hypothetical protein LCGC14_2418320, partial [marine sediment metagenome]
NDTIIIFDRIRRNHGKSGAIAPTTGTINKSINETMSRTLVTTFTTLIAVLTMYVAGGPGIRAFTFAVLVGVLFGTYSSVAVATPLLLGVKQAFLGRLTRAEPGKSA